MARDAVELGFDICWLSFDSDAEPGSLAGLREGTTAINNLGEFEEHLESNEPVALFLQSPYPEHYPDWFWGMSDKYAYCYSGYGVSLDTWEWGRYQLPSLKSCTWLLAESEFVRSKYLEHGNAASHVVVTGNPLMFEVRRRLTDSKEPVTERRTILWAPHWSASWFEHSRGYSRWQETVHSFLRVANDAVDTNFLVRPHPLFHQQLATPLPDGSFAVGDEASGAYFELLELSNVTLSSAGFVDDILRSDALLTDGLSIIAYYAATGRPMAIIRDEDSPPFNTVGDRICRASDVVSDSADIEGWLRRMVLEASLPISAERVALSRSLHPTWETSPLGILADRL